MKNISRILYILSFALVFSCTETTKTPTAPEPVFEPITGTVEELKTQVEELDKRLEHELEVIGQYQYGYIELRENMKAGGLYEHPKLKPMLIDFKKRGIGVVKSTTALLKTQREKIAAASEASKKNLYTETINSYRNQVKMIETAKPDLDNFVADLNALYGKLAPAQNN